MPATTHAPLYDRVPLGHTARPGWARLGALTGREEVAVEDASTATAIRLLDRLLVADTAAVVQPGQSADLTAADRDRLLAAVYGRAYGDLIVSTVTCAGCATPFELSFSLADLGARVLDQPPRAERLADGTFRLAGGAAVRLPTGRDELRVAVLPPSEAEEALYRACLVASAEEVTREALGEALESVAPVLDVELDAPCPECGLHEVLRFDVQSFVLGALVLERRRLLAEIHRLALAYGWTLEAILSLTRGDRRQYAALIDNESVRARRGLP